MFTKGDIRAALAVAIDINSDASDRVCNFSLTGISDGIMLSVHPHGKHYDYSNNWIYMAYESDDGYKSYKREYRHGIADGQSFPSLKEMLNDMKGVGT